MNFNEAFESITRSRHYEPPEPLPPSPPPAQPVVSVQPAVQKNLKSIFANPRQRGNPILRHIRSIPIEFTNDVNMPADFNVSQTTGILYLSVKYHKLNPDYLFARMEAMKRHFKLMIVLCQVDDVDCESALLRIQALCVANGFTTIAAFSEEEAARYLETFKAFEKKSSEEIEERKTVDYLSQVTNSLTQVRSVNKSDVKNLLRNFRSVGAILQAPMEDFALCAGVGEKKVVRLFNAFHKPFFNNVTNEEESEKNLPQEGTTVLTTNSSSTLAKRVHTLTQDILDDEIVIPDDDDDEIIE